MFILCGAVLAGVIGVVGWALVQGRDTRVRTPQVDIGSRRAAVDRRGTSAVDDAATRRRSCSTTADDGHRHRDTHSGRATPSSRYRRTAAP
ncbi:MAG TPA: hypothetical protein VKI00_27280 [Mycobacterium sp.]|uniref:hypothetical protein n=1 Tax=Mycobacterium sp. TaxID=1785 RepID=UPI002C1AD099|nr:hypothetical protein [Mycobacterium sp.]HME79227.1 hypothetical protein [Mycobacterium sp.]